MEVKYFVDEYGKIHCSTEDTGNIHTSFGFLTDGLGIVVIVSKLTGNILYKFRAYNSLEEVERVGYNTTPYRVKTFLQELSNLDEKSATPSSSPNGESLSIGAGKLANIKEQAEYLLNKLNKE